MMKKVWDVVWLLLWSRYGVIVLGTLVVVGALFYTDPDGGLSTGMLLLSVATGMVAVAAAHIARKGLFDYIDLRLFAQQALHSATGAGLVFVGVCAVICALLLTFSAGLRAQDVRTFMPPAATLQLPTLAQELRQHWPAVPDVGYVGALIEHESCITLRHSRCWQPTSRLKTRREEGAGLGQLTRAWRSNGRLRFDALAEARRAHPALQALHWDTIYARPDLQMRTVVLMSKRNFDAVVPASAHVHALHRLAFADAAYNGGLAGVRQERRACGLTTGCDAAQWFGHVEQLCLKSHAALYGGRSACDINRHHVRDVLTTRMPKYSAALRGMV